MPNTTFINAMFIIGPIFFVVVLIMIFVLGFSSKARGKMMSKQIKATKYMLDDVADDLKDMGSKVIDVKKDILTENEESLKNIAERESDISSIKVEKTAKAIKKGLTENTDTMYCKHCGKQIDADSKFCKKCGKEQ